ncbi:hypothetical protein SAMN05444583_12047 [Rhodococcus maanshanensis]|uniref:Uncharacterized protein n=1 Tax=Rhodococcus maanshanensis TaxID=183556 RepID=A0A1H7V1W8_9NOCA|nr:hypothetical protein SAMN05444583_12047 [Rhodococcus maanshanensis]
MRPTWSSTNPSQRTGWLVNSQIRSNKHGSDASSARPWRTSTGFVVKNGSKMRSRTSSGCLVAGLRSDDPVLFRRSCGVGPDDGAGHARIVIENENCRLCRPHPICGRSSVSVLSMRRRQRGVLCSPLVQLSCAGRGRTVLPLVRRGNSAGRDAFTPVLDLAGADGTVHGHRHLTERSEGGRRFSLASHSYEKPAGGLGDNQRRGLSMTAACRDRSSVSEGKHDHEQDCMACRVPRGGDCRSRYTGRELVADPRNRRHTRGSGQHQGFVRRSFGRCTGSGSAPRRAGASRRTIAAATGTQAGATRGVHGAAAAEVGDPTGRRLTPPPVGSLS